MQIRVAKSSKRVSAKEGMKSQYRYTPTDRTSGVHSTHLASTTIPERLHRVVHVFREDLVQLRTHLVHLGGFLVVQPGIVEHQPHVITELSMGKKYVQRHRKEV